MLPFPIMNTYGNTVLVKNVIKIATGINDVMVLMNNGNLYCTGVNTNGQLGLGDTTTRTNVWVLTNTNVQDVWCSREVTLIRKADNTWWITGLHYAVKGITVTSTTWEDVTSYFSALQGTYLSLSLSSFNLCIIDSNNNLYTSGFNSVGQLGTGNTTAQTSLTLRTDIGTVLDAKFAQEISNTFYVVKSSGELVGAGNSAAGQLLTTANQSSFKSLTTGVTSVAVTKYGVLASKADGLYSWGSTNNGQLGNNQSSGSDTVGISTMYKIPTFSTSPTFINCCNYTVICVYNGSWYYWGANSGGKSGNGSSGIVLVPTQITTTYPAEPDGNGVILGSIAGYFVGTNKVLYGSGTATNALPGYGTSGSIFKPLTPPE